MLWYFGGRALLLWGWRVFRLVSLAPPIARQTRLQTSVLLFASHHTDSWERTMIIYNKLG